MTLDWRPSYAYVPGQTPRHAEGLFERFKTGLDDVSPDCLHETRAWIFGLALLKDGYFWEAHEVLEAVWMACPPNAPERLMVQAVIQLANAELKRKMGRDRAAERLRDQSEKLFREAYERGGSAVLGICSKDAIKCIKEGDTDLICH